MESDNNHNIDKRNFDAFVHAVGSEIEQAQVRLITAANAQMLFHYWKMGNYILYRKYSKKCINTRNNFLNNLHRNKKWLNLL